MPVICLTSPVWLNALPAAVIPALTAYHLHQQPKLASAAPQVLGCHVDSVCVLSSCRKELLELRTKVVEARRKALQQGGTPSWIVFFNSQVGTCAHRGGRHVPLVCSTTIGCCSHHPDINGCVVVRLRESSLQRLHPLVPVTVPGGSHCGQHGSDPWRGQPTVQGQAQVVHARPGLSPVLPAVGCTSRIAPQC
jgi:hypothetical protein